MRLFPAISAIILFFTFTATGISWDGTWHYRTELSILNPSASDLTDLQVPINLSYNSAMQSDFSDIVFATASGTEVPFWIEEKTDSQWAYIWLRVPQIAALGNAQLFVYYHGPALNKSNISATFIHGDDFSSDTSIDYLYNGTAEWSDGYLKLIGPSYVHPLGQQPITNIVVEAKSNYSERETEIIYSGVYALSISGYGNYPDSPYTQKAIYGGNSTMKQLCYVDYQYPRCNENVSFTGADFQKISLYATTDITPRAELNRVVNASAGSAPTQWGQFGYVTTTDAWVDWLIVRKHATVQPTYLFGAEEEYSNLSIALNYPENNAINETTNLIWFSYTSIFTNYNITSCTFHVYIPGFTDFSTANSSEILNNSENLFNLTNVPYATLYWAIECVDDFYLKYSTSLFSENRTLVIAQPAPAPAPVPAPIGGGWYAPAPAAPAEEEAAETVPELVENETAENVAEEQEAEPVYLPPEQPTQIVTAQAVSNAGDILIGALTLVIIALGAFIAKTRK